MARITLYLLALLLVPSACSNPTIQADVYTWGYKDGNATYLQWTQCDYKTCEDVSTCIINQMDADIITYNGFTYDYDSLIFDVDCWTNECPDEHHTYIFE